MCKGYPCMKAQGYHCMKVKAKPGLCWRLQDIGNARIIGYLLRKAVDHMEPDAERSMFQSTKLKGVGELKSALTSHEEMQNWSSPSCFFWGGFFGPGVPHYGPFPPFRMIMYIPCHCILKVCDLFLF